MREVGTRSSCRSHSLIILFDFLGSVQRHGKSLRGEMDVKLNSSCPLD
jgi:hypothetical protein